MKKKALLILTSVLALCLAGCHGKKHEHTFSEEWDYDETYHWHNSTCEHELIKDKAEHKFVEHIDESKQIVSYDCSVCGYFYTESIDTDFTVKLADFYMPEKVSGDFVPARKGTIEYGYKDYNSKIIYMTLTAALGRIFDEDIARSVNGNIVTYSASNGMSFVVDCDKDTISANKYSSINLFSIKYDSPLGIIDEETTTDYVDVTGSVYSGEKEVVFNLKDYELDILFECGDAYIPFSIVNYITFNPAYYSPLVFNGEAFYLLDNLSGAYGLSASSNSYYKAVFEDGKYQDTHKPEELLEHNYHAFMFNLDHFYGFSDQRFVPFTNYLETNYPNVVKDLKSTSETEYCRAVEKIMEEIIGDNHTNVGNASTLFGTGSYIRGGYQSERSEDLENNYYSLSMQRYKSSVQVEAVRYAGNTAIFSFDSFAHLGEKFTAENIKNYADYDSFALFYKLFDEIKAVPNIKNVVIDLTVNGGGDTNAMVPMLSFLGNPVKGTMYCPLNNLKVDLSYKVDTNLDGVYDANDSLNGKYNFYILTSNYSFSCANAFTHICYENGWAKIIGEKSAGGSCVVYYTATPDGKCFRISGNDRFVDKNDVTKHYDAGVPVDYELAREHFYDDSYIASFINGL